MNADGFAEIDSQLIRISLGAVAHCRLPTVHIEIYTSVHDAAVASPGHSRSHLPTEATVP